jgi:hypothetical protein
MALAVLACTRAQLWGHTRCIQLDASVNKKCSNFPLGEEHLPQRDCLFCFMKMSEGSSPPSSPRHLPLQFQNSAAWKPSFCICTLDGATVTTSTFPEEVHLSFICALPSFCAESLSHSSCPNQCSKVKFHLSLETLWSVGVCPAPC